MKKIIRRSQVIGLILAGVCILAIVASILLKLFLADYEYYFWIQSAIGLITIVVFITFLWIHCARLSNLGKSTEMKVADILGNDVKEAYYFGKVGLIVTDDKFNIIWISEFLQDRNLEAYDQKIDDVFPELENFLLQKDYDSTVKVNYQNQIYEVKVIKEVNLFILKDVTEYETLFKYSLEQSPVVGYLIIDNFADVNAAYEQGKANDMALTVRRMILNYFAQRQVMIRGLKDDTFLLLCIKKQFDELYRDKFSIVDKVRNAFDEGYTLSIGMSYGFPDYSRLLELATNAVEVCLSRGGDQVTIAPFSENMEFIGGKTEARTSRNKVKLRTISQSLLTLISHSSKVLIMGHMNADFDAIGACLGIYAFANHVKIPARVIFEDQFIEKKARRAVKALFTPKEMSDIFINFKASHDFYDENTLIVIVDCNNPSQLMYPNIIDTDSRVAIIDHHRRSENFLENVIFSAIDTSASSASEMVAEYISYNHSKIELSEKFATIMLCGILLDTNYYRLKTSISTYEASTILKAFDADNEKANEFLKEDYEEYALKNKIMANSSTPYYGVLVCMSDNKDIVDISMLAIVARQALMIRGVNACFVIGRTSDDEVRISSRSDGTVNCQLLMEKMGGGGHFTSAACQFENMTVEGANKQLLQTLDEYLSAARDNQDDK